MYRALYNFDEGKDDRTLSFKIGDEFNLIEQVNEHWWKMQSLDGDIGLVPSSYLAINKVCPTFSYQLSLMVLPESFNDICHVYYYFLSTQ